MSAQRSLWDSSEPAGPQTLVLCDQQLRAAHQRPQEDYDFQRS